MLLKLDNLDVFADFNDVLVTVKFCVGLSAT